MTLNRLNRKNIETLRFNAVRLLNNVVNEMRRVFGIRSGTGGKELSRNKLTSRICTKLWPAHHSSHVAAIYSNAVCIS